MRHELMDLLRERRLCHPTRFERVEADLEGNLRIEVSGYPWWLERDAFICGHSLSS
jgi:hypothetical protein